MTYTVVTKNTLLGTWRGVGTFASEADATAYAKSEASRSRTFVVYEIWTGTPRNPIKRTSVPTIEGTQ